LEQLLFLATEPKRQFLVATAAKTVFATTANAQPAIAFVSKTAVAATRRVATAVITVFATTANARLVTVFVSQAAVAVHSKLSTLSIATSHAANRNNFLEPRIS
jgi:hypothetical protein